MSAPEWMVGGTEPRIRRAADIKPSPLDPVWDGILWAGKPTLFAGDPGLGKSMVTCDVVARVTTGKPWPCADQKREPANVVMLSAEDDAADTIVPRLMAAGADLANIMFVEGVTQYSEDGPKHEWLSLDKHLEQLSKVMEARKPRLLVIDPLSAYLGRGTDSHNEGDVRTVLSGLAELAAEYRAAVLAVRHLRKADSATAQHRIIGSVAFSAAARAVYVVTRDPENEDRRLLLCAKCNLAQDSAGYSYRIDTTDEGVPFVVWGEERETRTADEVLGASGKVLPVDEAERWVRQTLADGPVASKTMRELAGQAGHSWRTIERARGNMDDILIERDVVAGQGSRGPWQWRLATPPDSTPPTPAVNGGGVGGVGANASFPDSQHRQTARPQGIGNGGGVATGDTVDGGLRDVEAF